MNKSSSSVVAPGLKLKQEQQVDQQGSNGAMKCLELRLGISSSDIGSSPSWRVDPWSLASAHQRPDECDLRPRENSAAAAPPPQPVGWPPVRAFRRNLSSISKPADATDDALLLSKVKPDGDGERPPMLVKVNLEGCAVGRKVDLHAHRGYGSLSRALQSMFHGFLSDGQWRIAANKDEDEEEGEEPAETTKKGPNKTYILLYEDIEGDRMLVGDVPWELFVSSVKRLYIAQDRH